MSRTRLVYRCAECGYATPKWLGRCPECREWNTLAPEAGASPVLAPSDARAVPLDSEPFGGDGARITTGSLEFDAILGGGLVPGSVVLLGGEPGIGKSTLLLQVAAAVAQGEEVLLVSGEESWGQVKLRADRLGVRGQRVHLLAGGDLAVVDEEARRIHPTLAVVDSVQTVYHPDIDSGPGSVSQVREGAARLVRLAKDQGIAVCLVGHVTKEGSIAGPRLLEHMVDVVLYFEGDIHHQYRLLRATKNRFGPTGEVAIFEMKEGGLTEVANPSQWLLEERRGNLPGSVVVATAEGRRPLLTEVQALVSPAGYTSPRRVGSGIEGNRLALILAVLQQCAGLRVEGDDVYLSVAGGMRVSEPGMDLGIALAVHSAKQGRALPGDLAVFGEVGLAGELRYVRNYGLRLAEAGKLGFRRVIAPPARGERAPNGVKLCEAGTLQSALELID